MHRSADRRVGADACRACWSAYATAAPEATILALTRTTRGPDADGPRCPPGPSARHRDEGGRRVAVRLAGRICAEAAAVDGECVDVIAAFNGPDATTPSGDLLADDYTHPSQAGNDRIRDELLGVEG